MSEKRTIEINFWNGRNGDILCEESFTLENEEEAEEFKLDVEIDICSMISFLKRKYGQKG